MRLANELSPHSKGLGEWFRYYDTKDEPYVRLEKLPVLRETPAGVWLYYHGEEKFVLKNANKRWAYPTIELAQNSFRIRKRKQLGYLQSYFNRIKAINEALAQGTAFTELMQWKHAPGVFDMDEAFRPLDIGVYL